MMMGTILPSEKMDLGVDLKKTSTCVPARVLRCPVSLPLLASLRPRAGAGDSSCPDARVSSLYAHCPAPPLTPAPQGTMEGGQDTSQLACRGSRQVSTHARALSRSQARALFRTRARARGCLQAAVLRFGCV